MVGQSIETEFPMIVWRSRGREVDPRGGILEVSNFCIGGGMLCRFLLRVYYYKGKRFGSNVSFHCEYLGKLDTIFS